MKKSFEYYMDIALKEAIKARNIDEVPVGALVVDENGNILSKGYNKRESSFDPCGHAEIIAIKKACKKRKDWRLPDCTLFVTVEPCSMCAGTIVWARIKRVVYGAPDIKGGALGSSFNLFEQPNINHRPEIIKDILREECSIMIKEYFKNKR